MSMTDSKTSASGLIVDRRELMTGAAAVGLGFGLDFRSAFAQETPKKGGTLKLGMEGGSALQCSLDPPHLCGLHPDFLRLANLQRPGRGR